MLNTATANNTMEGGYYALLGICRNDESILHTHDHWELVSSQLLFACHFLLKDHVTFA